MFFERIVDLFKGNQQPQTSQQSTPSFYRSIYPESVRYAFQYKGAEMGKSELLALVNGFLFETVYLVTKAVSFNREVQRQYLEGLTKTYVKRDWQADEVRELLREFISLLPEDLTVTGTKLAQISRSGNGEWEAEWQKLASNLLAENPNALPCLIANTPMFGYHRFVEVYRDVPKANLILLMPDWIMDTEEEQMGYTIHLNPDPYVELQIKDTCLIGAWICEGVDCKLKKRFCTEAIFIDDTINTSTTSNKLRSFWLTEYGLNMPAERVRVITDLRGVESAKKIQKRN